MKDKTWKCSGDVPVKIRQYKLVRYLKKKGYESTVYHGGLKGKSENNVQVNQFKAWPISGPKTIYQPEASAYFLRETGMPNGLQRALTVAKKQAVL